MPSAPAYKPRFRSDKSRDARFHTRAHGALTMRLVAWQRARDKKPIEDFYTTEFGDGNEDVFQIESLDVLYAVMRDDFEAAAIPNGGKRDARTGAYLKRTGSRAGVYDLFSGWIGGDGWLELKSGRNKPTFAQKQFGAWLHRIGKRGKVVNTIASALWWLKEWGAPIQPQFLPLAELGRP